MSVSEGNPESQDRYLWLNQLGLCGLFRIEESFRAIPTIVHFCQKHTNWHNKLDKPLSLISSKPKR
jgi:hypothetical protein